MASCRRLAIAAFHTVSGWPIANRPPINNLPHKAQPSSWSHGGNRFAVSLGATSVTSPGVPVRAAQHLSPHSLRFVEQHRLVRGPFATTRKFEWRFTLVIGVTYLLNCCEGLLRPSDRSWCVQPGAPQAQSCKLGCRAPRWRRDGCSRGANLYTRFALRGQSGCGATAVSNGSQFWRPIVTGTGFPTIGIRSLIWLDCT
jgi:hypothetical protein